MGTLIALSVDKANFLPCVSSNAGGCEYWSGLHVSVLTTDMINDVLDFCRDEGCRKGWNEANWVDRNECCMDGPFPPELLDGSLSREWIKSYQEGRKNRLSNGL